MKIGLLCAVLKVMSYSFETFFSANKAAILCFVDLLYYVSETVLLELFR
jgi:hypothetical protein